MRLTLAAALVLALAVASPAAAKTSDYLGGFDKFDADNDGTITLAETKAFYKAKKKAKRLKQAPAIFKRWDADDDGKVTKDEYAAYAKSKAKDKDGGKKKKKPAKDEDADEE